MILRGKSGQFKDFWTQWREVYWDQEGTKEDQGVQEVERVQGQVFIVSREPWGPW